MTQLKIVEKHAPHHYLTVEKHAPHNYLTVEKHANKLIICELARFPYLIF